MASQPPLPERPNGSYVKVTSNRYDGRPVVSILVREDDPHNPDELRRWRAAEGNSNWLAWDQVLATGRVEPLYSQAELAAAAQRVPDRDSVPPPRQHTVTPPAVRGKGGARP